MQPRSAMREREWKAARQTLGDPAEGAVTACPGAAVADTAGLRKPGGDQRDRRRSLLARARWASRWASRSLMDWRLSHCFLPVPTAMRTLA